MEKYQIFTIEHNGMLLVEMPKLFIEMSRNKDNIQCFWRTDVDGKIILEQYRILECRYMYQPRVLKIDDTYYTELPDSFTLTYRIESGDILDVCIENEEFIFSTSNEMVDAKNLAQTDRDYVIEDMFRNIFRKREHTHVLYHLTFHLMYILFDKMSYRIYEKGKNIVTQGNHGDSYYVIVKGEVEIVKDGKRTGIILYEGMDFGEEALISGRPRNATVQAVSEAIVMYMNVDFFQELLQSQILESISPNGGYLLWKHEKYKILCIDCARECINQSFHDDIDIIPLHALRAAMAELDKDMHYIISSREDKVFAMVATFLLKKSGFYAMYANESMEDVLRENGVLVK
jgi:hypothetical protein